MFSKLTEAQKQFFETGRTRDLAFRICQLQLLADAMRKNETVLEEALKKDLGKSVFESYATEIGFVLADIRYTIQNLQKWSAPKRVRTPLYLFPGKSKIQKEPYGSVLILGPYNYPVQLGRASDRSDCGRKLCSTQTIRTYPTCFKSNVSDRTLYI